MLSAGALSVLLFEFKSSNKTLGSCGFIFYRAAFSSFAHSPQYSVDFGAYCTVYLDETEIRAF